MKINNKTKIRFYDKKLNYFISHKHFKSSNIELNFNPKDNAFEFEFDKKRYSIQYSLGKRDINKTLIFEGDLLRDDEGELIFPNGITIEDIVIGEERCTTNFDKVSIVGNILTHNVSTIRD